MCCCKSEIHATRVDRGVRALDVRVEQCLREITGRTRAARNRGEQHESEPRSHTAPRLSRGQNIKVWSMFLIPGRCIQVNNQHARFFFFNLEAGIAAPYSATSDANNKGSHAEATHAHADGSGSLVLTSGEKEKYKATCCWCIVACTRSRQRSIILATRCWSRLKINVLENVRRSKE